MNLKRLVNKNRIKDDFANNSYSRKSKIEQLLEYGQNDNDDSPVEEIDWMDIYEYYNLPSALGDAYVYDENDKEVGQLKDLHLYFNKQKLNFNGISGEWNWSLEKQ